MRSKPSGLAVRIVLLVALGFVGNLLFADVILPLPWGLLALAGYVAALLLIPVFAGNALCDQLDRRRRPTRNP